MAITYDSSLKIFSLDTELTSYQMQEDKFGMLMHLYYGGSNPGFVDIPVVYADRGFSGNPNMAGFDSSYSLDTLPQEYPALGQGDFRNCAINIQNADGSEYCALFYKSHKIKDGKYQIPGLPCVWAQDDEAQTLEIMLNDSISGITVTLLYGVLPEHDIITRCAVIKNEGKDEIVIKKALSAVLDMRAGNYDLITLYGRHAMERKLQRAPVPHGIWSIGSRRGTSSHEYNPAVMLTRPDTNETSGECWGMMFVYSGNFTCSAEKDQFDQVRLSMGLNDELFSYPLKPGDTFYTPEAVLSYSNRGIAHLSHNFHWCIRNHISRGKFARSKRPVVINSWEANYFDINAESILSLAKSAKELGIDTVVMDDGWFGARDDDTSSLGDWTVNEKKLGMPLKKLVEKVNAYGVGFGIWIEPEMINENSELYRKHPDWAMRVAGRQPVRGRHQLVLDFSRKDVRDHIYDSICAVLDSADISYVKWDMNRSISDVYNGTVSYDYMIGVYDFLNRLTRRYPNILIEGCSGGGGRFDAGMLYYTPQIWCSDNTDAINRLVIQYGTSFFYPLSSIGAHVSAVPNHQTGRVTSIYTRGVVAMTGAFGYELDPELLTPQEREQIKEQIKTFKKYEDLIDNGSYYRLSSPFKDKAAVWASVSHDKKSALLSAVYLSVEANMPFFYVRMQGLIPDAFYRAGNDGKIFTGAFLMEIGYALPLPTHNYEAYQILFTQTQL